MRSVQALAVAALLLLPAFDGASAGEPKQGGILRVYHRDSPGSASIHEGATYSVNIPFMPIFNNLVVFKQDAAQVRREAHRQAPAHRRARENHLGRGRRRDEPHLAREDAAEERRPPARLGEGREDVRDRARGQ